MYSCTHHDCVHVSVRVFVSVCMYVDEYLYIYFLLIKYIIFSGEHFTWNDIRHMVL